MTVKILLERKFKEDPSLEDIKTINELRMAAMNSANHQARTRPPSPPSRPRMRLSVMRSLASRPLPASSSRSSGSPSRMSWPP